MHLLLNRAPILEILPAVSHLLRTGLPPLYVAPEWVDRGVCPAGHWLCPEGTRLYYADEVPCEVGEDGEELETVQFTTPALVLDVGEATQMNPNGLMHWKVPLKVDLMLDRTRNRGELRGLMGNLQRVLTERIPTGDPATEQPWHRLTWASQAVAEADGLPEFLQVFTLGFREVKVGVIRNQNNHPMISLECEVRCGTGTSLPAAV